MRYPKQAAMLTGASAVMLLLIVTVMRIRTAAFSQGHGIAPVAIRGAIPSEAKTSSASGEVAGVAITPKPLSKSLPFAQSLLNKPLVQTQLAQPAQQVQYIYVPVNTNSSTQQSVQVTATPTTSSSASTQQSTTTTPTSQQSAQPTVAPATSTPTSIVQNQPTSTPTRIPLPTAIFIPTIAIQPSSTPQPATPTQSQPSMTVSLTVSASGDAVNATANASKGISLCSFKFWPSGGLPAELNIVNANGSTSCSASGPQATEKVQVTVKSNTNASEEANAEKSKPF